MPFWHLNGHLTAEGIEKQITDAYEKSGYGGMTVLPVSPGPHWHDGHVCPGMTPVYLSEEYFDRYADMLSVSDRLGTQIVLYDDIDFPSGSAGGRLLKEYPQYTRKYMFKDEFTAQGGKKIVRKYNFADNEHLMAVSAMNTTTSEVVDLGPRLKDGQLVWNAPAGEWKIMAFTYRYAAGGVHGHLVDYMQPEAVAAVIGMTYDRYDRFESYYGNVIRKTFFDDVGFVHMENTWTPAISDIFREKTGRDPALYYPALYYDIGPETGAARVAFFDARSELMAEGYVKQAAEWSDVRGLRSMGHPPENYSPNSVAAHGDILKYYRHVHIPLLDIIFYYGRGLNGYKQIASAADRGDKGIVGAELNGAFFENMDSLTLYRTAMEAMARGVNFIVPHGLWYDTTPENIRIPPLISWDNPYWGEAVPDYSRFTSRSCVLLQEGKRVVDIGVLWPIAAIQAESWINRDDHSPLPVANWVPDNVNHYELSGMLTNELRRDFTYIHPEDLTDGTVVAEGSELVLANKINRQEYKVLIMPGGDVISAATLGAIKKYYDGGGKVIATVSLPLRSAEFGRDAEIETMIVEIFGSYPDSRTMKSNTNGGIFCFLPGAGKTEMELALAEMEVTADVAFVEEELGPAEIGYLNYTHKQKDGCDIYYFVNTTDRAVSTTVKLRGKIKNIEVWDPHSGAIEKLQKVGYIEEDGVVYTRAGLSMPAVRSLFFVAQQ